MTSTTLQWSHQYRTRSQESFSCRHQISLSFREIGPQVSGFSEVVE
jgi:hypothetical protein